MELVIAIGANLVVGAILLAVFAWRRPPCVARIGIAEIALDLIRESVPDAEGTVVVSSDGESACLIGADPGMTCLLQRHGYRYNVRRLQSGDVRKLVEVGGSIKFRLRDFGWPECRVSIPDPRLRLECLARLSALTTNQISESSSVGSHA